MLRVGFAGTPAFAAVALEAILAAGFSVPLVLTRPDRPKGRGLKLEAAPVKGLAAARGLPILQPPSLRTPEGRAAVVQVPVDVLVVAAFGLILPPAVLGWPRHGCLNIHASLLPRWRGAAPIQRAVAAGDATSGVTIMQMDEGLDTGPVVSAIPVSLAPRETAGTLQDKLARAGADAIVAVLARLDRDGYLAATAQSGEGAIYAPKIARTEAEIDWRHDAATLDRLVRALDPAPGAFTWHDGAVLKIAAAVPVARTEAAPAGTVVAASAEGIDVACGDTAAAGALRILEAQPAGRRRMPAAALVNGRLIAGGARLGTRAAEAP